MSADSAAEFHQDSKDRLQKKLVKYIKDFLKKPPKKNNNMVVNKTNLSKDKKQRLFEYRGKLYKMRVNAVQKFFTFQ